MPLCGFGAFGIRAVTIPFYATSSEAQVLYMLGDADIHYLLWVNSYSMMLPSG